MGEMNTLPELLAYSAHRFGDSPAFQTLNEEGEIQGYTYRQIAIGADLVAKWLAQRGVARCDHVALISENRPEWSMAYFAIHLLGAVVVPVDTRLGPDEIRDILVQSCSKTLVSSEQMGEVARQAAAGLDGLNVVYLEQALSEKITDQAIPFPDLPLQNAAPDDIAVITFTSGATGDPKGIMLTHRNIASNITAASQAVDCYPDDRFISLLPLSHVFEKTAGMLVPFYNGACVTYVHSLNPRIIAEAMQKLDTTICLIVPAVARLFHKRIVTAVAESPLWRRTFYHALMAVSRAGRRRGWHVGRFFFRKLRRRFGSQMRYFVSGGAPLDPEIAEFFDCIGLPILQGYGLSEAAPIVSTNTILSHRLGSVGRPIPGLDVVVQPREGCEPGAGEVLVRGPNIMAGYFQDAQATAQVLRDGYLHTGDIGWLDDDGYLFISGRLKNVIIGESGKNVSPEEVEKAIARSPLIKEVCVLGRRNGSRSEEVAALVVPHDELSQDKSETELSRMIRTELRKVCRTLADYKRPKYFALSAQEFPKTTTLKIKKPELLKQIQNYPFRPV